MYKGVMRDRDYYVGRSFLLYSFIRTHKHLYKTKESNGPLRRYSFFSCLEGRNGNSIDLDNKKRKLLSPINKMFFFSLIQLGDLLLSYSYNSK
jgi:hypothetical protein